jgi:hypothetical protein
MRTSSAKAKGRRATVELTEALLAAFPMLETGDIRAVSSGCPGVDVVMSPLAQATLPFAIEVKNQESLNIWQSLKQAESHAEGTSLMPLLAFRRNRSQMYVALSLSDFIRIITSGITTSNTRERTPTASTD